MKVELEAAAHAAVAALLLRLEVYSEERARLVLYPIHLLGIEVREIVVADVLGSGFGTE